MTSRLPILLHLARRNRRKRGARILPLEERDQQRLALHRARRERADRAAAEPDDGGCAT